MEPKAIPKTKPEQIPTAPQPKTKANNPANIISSTNDLRNVIISDDVPFPMAWNMLPARIPKGMNRIKKHNMRNVSTTLGARIELSAEYENMNDKGSANMNKNEQMITEEIKPNLIP